MPQQMSHVTADRAYVGAFQIKLRKIVQLVQPQRSIDTKFVSADLVKLFLLEIELILNVSDEFLQYIFQCHKAHGPAKFIHYDGHVRVLTEEQSKQVFERHHFRDWKQFAFDLHQIGMRITHHGKQFLDVNQADRIIQVFTTQRKARMLGFDRLCNVRIEIVLNGEVNNVAARRHDVTHDAVAQIENIEDEFTAEWSNISGFFALLENQS